MSDHGIVTTFTWTFGLSFSYAATILLRAETGPGSVSGFQNVSWTSPESEPEDCPPHAAMAITATAAAARETAICRMLRRAIPHLAPAPADDRRPLKVFVNFPVGGRSHRGSGGDKG